MQKGSDQQTMTRNIASSGLFAILFKRENFIGTTLTKKNIASLVGWTKQNTKMITTGDKGFLFLW